MTRSSSTGRVAPDRLFNTNYLLLWQGQAVSMLGSGFSRMAIMLWIVETTNSATMMGTLMMAAAIPNILLGPVSGAAADRFSRKNIIVICDLLSGLFCLLLAAALYLHTGGRGSLIVITILYVGIAVTNLFFGSAVLAITPDLVPVSRIRTANALEMMVQQLTNFTGKGLGGLLYTMVGGPVIFILDGITYLVSAFSESFISTERGQAVSAAVGKKNLRQLPGDIKQGFTYILQDPGLKSIILVYGGINFFIEPFFVLIPFYVTDPGFLNTSIEWVGYLFAGLAIGTTAGYWLADRLAAPGRRGGRAVLFSMLATGVGYGALAIIHQPRTALLLMTVNGIFGGVTSNFVQSLLQIKIPSGMRGRVLSVLTTLVLCLSPLALWMSGFAADRLDHRLDLIFLACGGMMTVISLWGCMRKEFRLFLRAD